VLDGDKKTVTVRQIGKQPDRGRRHQEGDLEGARLNTRAIAKRTLEDTPPCAAMISQVQHLVADRK